MTSDAVAPAVTTPTVRTRIVSADRSAVLAVVSIMVGSGVLHLWGIAHELPVVLSDDELLFVRPALHIAATGDLNPHFFGNPGSTLIYPLALIYALAGVTSQADGILIGRLVASLAAVACLPAVYALADPVGGRRVAIAATALTAVYPIGVTMSQLVRTDSVATLFMLLALLAIFDLLEHPSWRRHAGVGVLIGLAVASRFFMASLLVPYVAVHLWTVRGEPRGLRRHRPMLAGLAAAAVTFAATTPFMFLDWMRAAADLQNEARAVNPGGDGLSTLGNLAWYGASAIPASIGWPMIVAVVAAVVFVARTRSARALLVTAFAAAYFGAVSLSHLHWAYYVIPILPLFATLAFWAVKRVPSSRWRTAAIVLGAVIFGVGPALATMSNDRFAAGPTTRLAAREWVLANIARGSSIAEEWYTAPVDDEGYLITPTFTLSEHSLEDYRGRGVRYLIATSSLWDRFYADPERYPAEVAFYDRLFREGRLLWSVQPDGSTGGPEIRVFAI